MFFMKMDEELTTEVDIYNVVRIWSENVSSYWVLGKEIGLKCEN